MKSLSFFYLLLVIGCSPKQEIDYSNINKWENDNISYINSCCKDSTISKSYLIFFKQRNHFIKRNRLEILKRINAKVSLHNKTITVIERLVLEEPREYVYLWEEKSQKIYSFQYFNNKDSLISTPMNRDKSKRLRSYNWKEEMLANPCCSQFPVHTSFDIYTKLKIENNKLVVLESYVSPSIW